MTDSNYTHYAILVDRTGSMRDIATETEAGIAAYLKEQATLPGKATYSLFEFDSWYTGDDSPMHSDMSIQLNRIKDFAPISEDPHYVLNARGYTPLYDAQGMTITSLGSKLAAMPEGQRPGKVVFVTATDGLNNASTEWDAARVKALVTQQERDYGWKFTYIGANQDAFAQGGAMGVHTNSALNYSATKGGTRSAWGAAAAASTRYASGQSADITYTDDERKAAEEK
jgi:hypothetical protein